MRWGSAAATALLAATAGYACDARSTPVVPIDDDTLDAGALDGGPSPPVGGADASGDAAEEASVDAGADASGTTPLPSSCTRPALATTGEDACGPPCAATTSCDGHTYEVTCTRGACFSYSCSCKRDGQAAAWQRAGDAGFSDVCNTGATWEGCRF